MLLLLIQDEVDEALIVLRLDDVLSPQSQSQLLLLLLGETEVDVLRLDDVVLSSQSQLLLLLLSMAVEEEVLILVEYKELVDGLVERLETEDKVLEVVSSEAKQSCWKVAMNPSQIIAAVFILVRSCVLLQGAFLYRDKYCSVRLKPVLYWSQTQ